MSQGGGVPVYWEPMIAPQKIGFAALCAEL
jgi:hypothetical protein